MRISSSRALPDREPYQHLRAPRFADQAAPKVFATLLGGIPMFNPHNVQNIGGTGRCCGTPQTTHTPRLNAGDRVGPMKTKITALMLVDLGVRKSRSRPPTSNDNPFSVHNLKTTEYEPEFSRH